MRMLGYADLRGKGIKFSRQHLHRLIKQKKFPAPVKMGKRTNAWPEPEVDQHLEDRIAERDAASSRTA